MAVGRPSSVDALGEAIDTAIIANPELAADLDRFVSEAIRDARLTLRHGTPDARLALQKLVLEGAIKASARKSDESFTKLEREFHDFRRSMTDSAATVAVKPPVAADIATDAPRVPVPSTKTKPTVAKPPPPGKVAGKVAPVRVTPPIRAPTPTPHQRAADFLAKLPRAPGPRPR